MLEGRKSRREKSIYNRIFRKNSEQKAGRLASKKNKRAESQQIEEQLQLLKQYSTDTVYRLSYETMSYDFISPNVLKLFGYTAEEMAEINIRDMIVEARMVNDGLRQVYCFEELEELRKTRQTNQWHADYQIQTKSGEKIWVSDISYPWLNDEGEVIGSVGSLTDITSRVEAEAVMREELVRLANVDALTGLYNRTVFFDRLDHEIKRQSRAREDMSICIIDVDHFKKINDYHGHYAGDQVLAQISQIILSCLRETDTAARLGGEEFGILLPDTSTDGAFWVADRIRESVAKFNFTVGEEQVPVGCTVSIGIAGLSIEQQRNATELYKLADTRLYIAKNTGRNQVSVDEVLSLH